MAVPVTRIVCIVCDVAKPSTSRVTGAHDVPRRAGAVVHRRVVGVGGDAFVRAEPHSGVCSECDGLVIDALLAGEPIRLDAKPTPDGLYRAFHSPSGWIARPAPIVNDVSDMFMGMRRSEHQCRPADKQLALGAA